MVRNLKDRQKSPEIRTTYGEHRITVFNESQKVLLDYKETLQDRCKIEFKRGFAELYKTLIKEK